MTVTIDGEKFDSLEGFYDQIEQLLIKGECPWGRNLDSLDEIVQSNFNYTDNEALNVSEIIWKHSAISERQLGTRATIEWWATKLRVADAPEQREYLQRKIKQVECGKEPTLFTTLKEILNSNENIRLTLN